MLKKLLSHSFLYSLAPQIPKIATLVLMPVITRYLTATDYGIYGIIMSYLFISTALKDLGFSVVFVNTFYKFPHRWQMIWRMLYGHLMLWSVFFVVLLLGLLWLAVPPDAAGNFWWIALLTILPAVLFENTALLGNYYYRFSQKPGYIAFTSALAAVVSVACTYYCIVYLRLGYMSWFIASFATALTLFLLYLYPVYGKLKLYPIMKWRPKFIKPHLKVALPMIPHNYSSYLLNSSDRVIMDAYKINVNRIGVYNIAYQFGNYFESFGDAVGMAVGPFFSKLYTSQRPQAESDARVLTFFLMSFFLLSTFVTSLWLKEIFSFLIRNEELKKAYGIGIIILMAYSYKPMYWSSGIKLSLNEKTGMLWRISFIAGLINVLLNIVFIPLYGIYSAAIITFISLLYMGFSGFYFKSFKKIQSVNFYPQWWMLAICVLTAVAVVLRDAHYTIKLGLSFFLIAVAGFYFFKNYARLQAIDI